MWRWVELAALMAGATHGRAAAPEPWQATGPFKILPAVDRCVAAIDFKRGDQSLAVALESHPSTIDYEMRVYAPGDIKGAPWVQGKYSLGEARLEEDWVVARASTRVGMLIYAMDITRPALQSAGSNPILKIQEVPNSDEMTIAGLDAAVSLLDSCSENLLESWGYSKESQAAVASYAKPKKPLSSYTSPTDYPISALSSGAEGDTYALIDVEIDGRSRNCRVIRSSGNRELDKTTCSIVTGRVRYDPARNESGELIPAPYYLNFRWEIAK